MTYANQVRELINSDECKFVTESTFSVDIFELICTRKGKADKLSVPIAKFAAFQFSNTARWVADYLNFAKFLKHYELLDREYVYLLGKAITQLEAGGCDSKVMWALRNMRAFLAALYDIKL